jgi:hypothetical protein
VSKRIGYSYPFHPDTFEEILHDLQYCDNMVDVLLDFECAYGRQCEKDQHQGLNFLKTICKECKSRDELMKCVAEIWRQKTYGPKSKVYFKAKENFERVKTYLELP